VGHEAGEGVTGLLGPRSRLSIGMEVRGYDSGRIHLLGIARAGGREVTIAVNEIVSMREGEGKGEYLTDQMRCMINTEMGSSLCR